MKNSFSCYNIRFDYIYTSYKDTKKLFIFFPYLSMTNQYNVIKKTAFVHKRTHNVESSIE